MTKTEERKYSWNFKKIFFDQKYVQATGEALKTEDPVL